MQELCLYGISQCVVDFFSLSAAGNQSALFQAPQMMGNGRGAHSGRRRKIADAFLAMAQEP